MSRRNCSYSCFKEASFESDIDFDAIISCLLRGRYLKSLKFKNIAVEEHILENSSRSIADYQLPYLNELKFYGSPCLTSDDYSLLHWINTKVTIPNLESFAFIGDIRFGIRQLQANAINETDPYILEDFLISHRASLRHLSLSGVFIVNIVGQDPYDLQTTTAIVGRNLRSLSISSDIPNLEVLLKDIGNLEILMWDKYEYFDETVAQNVSALLSCIQSNWTFLRCIEITPVIICKDISDDLLQILTIDCEVFEECYSLQILKLRQNFNTDIENHRNAVPGRVRNIHLLPVSLQVLEIWTDRYEKIDLELLEARFEKFISLHTFYLTCPSNNSYVVPSSWIKAIQKMHMNVAIFVGGILKNTDDVKRSLRRNFRSRTRLTWADDNRIVLQRN